MRYSRTNKMGVDCYVSEDGRVVVYVGKATPSPRRVRCYRENYRLVRYKPQRAYRVRVDGKAVENGRPFWYLADAKEAGEAACS
jgi:hypothetical protein